MNSTENQEVLDTALTLIHSRQHTSPKRLGDPGPDREQIEQILISAGCAVQNMLLAAHAMGLGAGLSSGRAMYSGPMRRLFGLAADEQPLCFMTVGTVLKRKPARARPTMGDYCSTL